MKERGNINHKELFELAEKRLGQAKWRIKLKKSRQHGRIQEKIRLQQE
jgi:hypothetical protein